jgi:hypothetical protein
MNEFDENNSVPDIPTTEPSQKSDSGPLMFVFTTLFIASVLGFVYTIYCTTTFVTKESIAPACPLGYHDPLSQLKYPLDGRELP